MRLIPLLLILLTGCVAMPSGDPIRIGMTKAEVVAAWGEPSDINRTLLESAEPEEQWVYENYRGRTVGYSYQFVYFRSGKVFALQD